jgi:hypothetical protein
VQLIVCSLYPQISTLFCTANGVARFNVKVAVALPLVVAIAVSSEPSKTTARSSE